MIEPTINFENNQPHFRITKGTAQNRKKKSNWRVLRFLRLVLKEYGPSICFLTYIGFIALSSYVWGFEGFKISVYILAGIGAVLLSLGVLVGIVFLIAAFFVEMKFLWDKSKNV